MSLKDLKKLVDEQAEDERLWSIDDHFPDVYKQRALRELHHAVESFISQQEEGQDPEYKCRKCGDTRTANIELVTGLFVWCIGCDGLTDDWQPIEKVSTVKGSQS